MQKVANKIAPNQTKLIYYNQTEFIPGVQEILNI